jgi:hypothetical protein
MIDRLVKMTFKPEHTPEFIRIFEGSKDEIAAFPGCLSLRLMRDKQRNNIYFTYSIWESENDLEAYRNSALFADTWSRTKVLFQEKAEAWTLQITDQVK